MASPKHYKILPNNENLIYSSYSKFLILNSCLVKNSIFYALVVRCGNELTFPLLRIRNMPHLSIKVSPGVKILYVEPKYVKVTNYLVGEEIGKILNPCSFMAFLQRGATPTCGFVLCTCRKNLATSQVVVQCSYSTCDGSFKVSAKFYTISGAASLCTTKCARHSLLVPI